MKSTALPWHHAGRLREDSVPDGGQSKSCDGWVCDEWFLVGSSGVFDETESDSFSQDPSSSGKGILINDDEEHFGLMDNDSPPSQVETFVLAVKPPGQQIQNAQNVCAHEWATWGAMTDTVRVPLST